MIKRFFAFLFFVPSVLLAQLQLASRTEPPLMFGGRAQQLEILFKNPTEKTITAPICFRIYQANSATLAPMGEQKDWKSLQILPGQTVVEAVMVDVPKVRVVTEFRVRFSANETQIGELKLRVAPDGLLKTLTTLTGKTSLGILDPDNQLKPLLKENKIEFHDLEHGAGFDEFDGKLAILGPFVSTNSVPENVATRIVTKRKDPLAIVWIQRRDAKRDPLLPIYVVRTNGNVITVVQSDAVAHLADSPQSQLILLRAADLALHPASLLLPSNKAH